MKIDLWAFEKKVREKGFTKIAFGHHLDDIAETIILNQFYRILQVKFFWIKLG